jgi:hypothetical protein
MDVWIRELLDIVQLVLGRPQTLIEYSILLVLGIVVLMLAMYMVGSALRIPNLGLFRRALAMTIGLLCLVCAWVGVQMYVLPYVQVSWLRLALSIGLPALSAVLIITPVQQAILRSAYAATLITFVVSIAVTGFVIVLANSVADAVYEGNLDSERIKSRTESIDRIIEL